MYYDIHWGFSHKLTIDWMMSQMLYREMENFGAAAEKVGPGQHMESLGCKNCETCKNVRKCVCFAAEPPWKTFQKPCKNLAKSLNFCDILQNSSVFTLIVVGENAPLWRVVQKNCGKSAKHNAFRLFFDVLFNFCKEVLLLNVPYFANIFCTFP